VSVLSGKVAVITGGTSGIGAAIAATFANEGATVVLAGRRTVEGRATAERLGLAATFVRVDVAVEDEVAQLVADTVARFGAIDILVNNAGEPGPGGPIADFDLDAFRRTVDVHVGGVLAGMKHAAPHMTQRGSGSIINMSSTTARLAGWSGIGYSAAKAAIVQATRAVAVELGEHGVRVNTISPGPILTGIFAKGAGVPGDVADRTAPELASAFGSALEPWQPIRRPGTTRDVAAAALFLAGDASAFITGTDLVVDGGISAGRPARVAIAERAQLATALRGGAST